MPRRTPWAFSQQVPAGQPVHVRSRSSNATRIFDDEADLKVGDGDAIEFDVIPLPESGAATSTGRRTAAGPASISEATTRTSAGRPASTPMTTAFWTSGRGPASTRTTTADRSRPSGPRRQSVAQGRLRRGRLPARPRTTLTARARTRSSGSWRRSPTRRSRIRTARPASSSTSTSGPSMEPARLLGRRDGRRGGTYGDFGGGNAIRRGGKRDHRSFGLGRGRHQVRGSGGRQLRSQSRALLPIRHLRPSDEHSRRGERLHHWRGRSVQRDLLVTLGGVDVAGLPCFQTEAGVSVDRLPNRRGRSCTTWVTC